ncbi:aspartate aminotransferase family protein [Candidatus Bathyarchaeota archaeon]|nr:MAG: aspartate aminotransferase family protein [Candidatus Bathyarchaeota archaeon]
MGEETLGKEVKFAQEYIEYCPGVNTRKSWELFQEAKELIPGGVSSHARVWSPYPICFVRGEGSKIWDIDGNCFIDYILAMGPDLLGHCHTVQVEAITKMVKQVSHFVGSNELEVALAKKIKEICPHIDMIRFSCSGSEATYHAMRIARAYTGKDKVIKFEGGYHGHHDYACCGMSIAGPPHAPYVVPSSWGVPQDTLKTMIVLPWNDLTVLEKTIKRKANEIAAVITEPVLMNIGCVPPEEGYLKGVQELCAENDIVFILDEVITGFRLGPGGAAEYFNLKPDLVTYAKALSSGYPLSAVAGKKELMENVLPGRVIHAGTLNANPVAVASALATLNYLTADGGAAYKHLNKIANMLKEGLEEAIEKTKSKAIYQSFGAAGGQVYFTELKKIRNFREAQRVNIAKYKEYHLELFKRGILVHPSQHEHIFISTAHTEEDVEKAISAATEAMRNIS